MEYLHQSAALILAKQKWERGFMMFIEGSIVFLLNYIDFYIWERKLYLCKKGEWNISNTTLDGIKALQHTSHKVLMQYGSPI